MPSLQLRRIPQSPMSGISKSVLLSETVISCPLRVYQIRKHLFRAWYTISVMCRPSISVTNGILLTGWQTSSAMFTSRKSPSPVRGTPCIMLIKEHETIYRLNIMLVYVRSILIQDGEERSDWLEASTRLLTWACSMTMIIRLEKV